MSTARVMQGGRLKRTQVPRGPNGRGLCRWCGLEVPPRRFTFCSAGCVHEWKLRSQPAYLRTEVLLRDKGRCAGCGVDALLELRRLKRSRGNRRLELMAYWGLKTKMRSLWDADHILPVVEGGGECDLLNLRTLCLRCHRTATAALRERIRRAKVAAMLLKEPKAQTVHGGPGRDCREAGWQTRSSCLRGDKVQSDAEPLPVRRTPDRG